MNSIRFTAKLTPPGRSGAVVRTIARRRLAAGSVALAAALAGLAFNAGPAHASGLGFCLDANAQQAHNFGKIIQWQCDDSDNYQNWTFTLVANPPGVGALFQFKNNGTGYCLDANAQQVYDGGAIIQYSCDASDPYQLWMVNPHAGNEAIGEFRNYGAYTRGAADCLDANAQQVYDGGAIIQYSCDASDPYQQWTVVPSDKAVVQNVGASA